MCGAEHFSVGWGGEGKGEKSAVRGESENLRGGPGQGEKGRKSTALIQKFNNRA